jgi:hypothetical protein
VVGVTTKNRVSLFGFAYSETRIYERDISAHLDEHPDDGDEGCARVDAEQGDGRGDRPE